MKYTKANLQSAVTSAMDLLFDSKMRKEYVKRVVVPAVTLYSEEKRLARKNLEQKKLTEIRQKEQKLKRGEFDSTELPMIAEVITRPGYKKLSPQNQYFYLYKYVYEPTADTFEIKHSEEYKKSAPLLERAHRELRSPTDYARSKLTNSVPKELIKKEYFEKK